MPALSPIFDFWRKGVERGGWAGVRWIGADEFVVVREGIGWGCFGRFFWFWDGGDGIEIHAGCDVNYCG